MSEMVERVAGAIAYEMGYVWGSSGVDHEELRTAARAAIAATREPTEAMLVAAAREVVSEAKWRAMVDAALDDSKADRKLGDW